MRALLDTNILARAATSTDGPAAAVLEFLRRPEHALIVSWFLFIELDRVLRYPLLRRLHEFSDDDIEQYIHRLRLASVEVAPTDIVPVVQEDPDDDLVIAAAIAADADVICTLDRHFQQPAVQEYCADRGLQIMSDVALLEFLRQSGS